MKRQTWQLKPRSQCLLRDCTHRRQGSEAQKRHVLVFFSGDVIETPAELTNGDGINVERDELGVPAGRTWPIFEWSERALHTKEYMLK